MGATKCWYARGKGASAAMAEGEIAQDALIVHVEGMDRLFALRSRLEVPLSHVAGAEADPEEARRRWHGIMERGVWVPGSITAGPLFQKGGGVIWGGGGAGEKVGRAV